MAEITNAETRPIVIVGAGGHGRELLGALLAAGCKPKGFLDDNPPPQDLLRRIGANYLGTISLARAHLVDSAFIIGIGSGHTRSAIDRRLSAYATAEPVVHPRASLDLDVRLSPGSVVFAQATVTTNISIGRHTHIGRGAAVGHDTSIGDYVTVMPLASVSGNVRVGHGATIGTSAVIRQGQTIGTGAFVGAGAVVVSDVPPGVTVVGNPARPVRA